MMTVIDTLKNLVSEADHLIEAAVKGNLETRGDIEKFHGGYREIIEGFNRTLDAVVEPLNVALPYMQAMADGLDPGDLENEFAGQYGILIGNLNQVRDSFNTMLDESMKLNEAAEDGRLSYRADISKLKGGYAQIVSGINGTLESLIKPLNVAAEYMEQIGKGEIPEKIMVEYNGDFNKIKSRRASMLALMVWAACRKAMKSCI